MKDTDRWEESGFPWDMLESVVCRGAAGAMLRAPRGAKVEDLQNVMDPQRGRGAARRQMQTEKDAFRRRSTNRGFAGLWIVTQRNEQSRGSQSRKTWGEGGGGRLEENFMCSWTPEESFASLTQYKHISPTPVEQTKHKVQCVQKNFQSPQHAPLNNCQQTPASGFSTHLTWENKAAVMMRTSLREGAGLN